MSSGGFFGGGDPEGDQHLSAGDKRKPTGQTQWHETDEQKKLRQFAQERDKKGLRRFIPRAIRRHVPQKIR